MEKSSNSHDLPSNVQITNIKPNEAGILPGMRDRLGVRYSGSKINHFPSLLPFLVCNKAILSGEKIRAACGKGINKSAIGSAVVGVPGARTSSNLELGDETARKIECLKIKLVEQLRTIDSLTKNSRCSTVSLVHEHDEKMIQNSEINSASINFPPCLENSIGQQKGNSSVSDGVGSLSNSEKPQKCGRVKKQRNKRNVKPKTAKLSKQDCEKTSTTQRPAVKQIRPRRKRRCRNSRVCPQVLEMSERLPHELTKEEFLRHLRLIPITRTQLQFNF